MKIDHIAIWVEDLERSRQFYERYFTMTSGEQYQNPSKGFTSYFLSFASPGSPRIELMHAVDITENVTTRGRRSGYAHLAISVGSKDLVDKLTEQMRSNGEVIIGEPRTTGDGYYESVVQDPEGNWIEITV